MPTITITLTEEMIKKIKDIAISNDEKFSRVIQKILEVGLKFGEPMNVKCPICSTEYMSNKGFCPKCKKELEERELKLSTEKDINILQQRLEKLLDWKEKGFFVTETEINGIKAKIEELQKVI